MRIHHLNCGTLRPLGGRRINGNRLPFLTARMVCHCLLIETDQRLVLVDSGFGQDDIGRLSRLRSVIRPRQRLDPADTTPRQLTRHAYSMFAIRPRLDPAETAVRQVAELGYSPDDVRDIVLTHLDLDHAGGLPDFPAARVHVHQAEYNAAMSAATSDERSIHRFRYWPYQWAHGPEWVMYTEGDRWFGFEAVRELQGLPDIALVPLHGHSRGHAGVAVHVGDAESGTGSVTRWLLHAGDAYFDHREVDPVEPQSTPGLASFQNWLQADRSARRRNRARLRELAAEHGDDVEFFSSHDPVEFDRYRDGESSSAPGGAA
jgi:glyoxylase-like metal-dependent hydrolase (beta-lactamase superfamily II)